jgi:hypothetical protein
MTMISLPGMPFTPLRDDALQHEPVPQCISAP